MNFVKRAVLYCLRQRVKTLLLFLVLTILAVFLLTAMAVREAVGGQAAKVHTAIGGKILLDLDVDGHMGDAQQTEWGTAYSYNGDRITREIVEAICQVDGVADYNVEEEDSYLGAGVNFKYLPGSLGVSYTPYGEASSYIAALSTEKCRAFQNGSYRLVEGRHITRDDRYACLLSKELTDYNHLSVGDTVRLYSLDADAQSSFTIVGIFDGTEGKGGNALLASDIPANCGYVDCAAVQDIFKDFEEEDGYNQLTIYVEDPARIQTVYEKIAALPELKGKTLTLTMDTEEDDAVSTPLDSLQTSVRAAIWIGLAVSMAVLTLLLTIWIRGRRREMGILLSLGRSKTEIFLQLLSETFAAALLSFAASIPLGAFTVQQAGAFLASKAGSASLQAPLNAAVLLPFAGIGSLLLVAAVLVSSWSVLRLQPREILRKME